MGAADVFMGKWYFRPYATERPAHINGCIEKLLSTRWSEIQPLIFKLRRPTSIRCKTVPGTDMGAEVARKKIMYPISVVDDLHLLYIHTNIDLPKDTVYNI